MIYLLNEVAPGHAPTSPRAIDVFSSAAAVESHLEPWYVDESYLLLREDGRRCTLKIENGKVRLALSEQDERDYSDVLKSLLVAYLHTVEEAIRRKKDIGDAPRVPFEELPVHLLLTLALLVS